MNNTDQETGIHACFRAENEQFRGAEAVFFRKNGFVEIGAKLAIENIAKLENIFCALHIRTPSLSRSRKPA